MSITSQIIRIQTNIANAYDAAEAKGATLPTTKNSENLSNTIASITTSGGAGGDSITYTNITGATIAKDNKLWINTTATTTEESTTQISVLELLQTSNPNVALTSGYRYTLQDGAYIKAALTKNISFSSALGIDKNGILSSNYIYNIENNIFATQNGVYLGNGYISSQSSFVYKIDITNPANKLSEHVCTNSAGHPLAYYGWSIEDDIIIGLTAPNFNKSNVLKLDHETSKFNAVKSLSLGAICPIGQFTEQKILFGLDANATTDRNLVAYQYSKNGDDVNVVEIPATEFPDDMRPMFTEQPKKIFWNEQTLTLSAIWQSPFKILIFKYINGVWVNKTPIINEYTGTGNLSYLTCDSTLSKIVICAANSGNAIIYDGNEKSAGYYAVPYLYSRKETFTAKADEECVNNATSTASAYLPANKIIPPVSGGPAGSTPVIIPPSELKFGDRIDNKATVVGTYNSNDLGTVVYAVLDAQYRGANIAWASGLFGIDTGLPNYSVVPEEQNHESATYNTDYIINNYSDKATEAFTFCRNIEPLTYNGNSYNCQLPNGNELLEIFNKKAELDTLDPTAETNSTNKLSNWGFGCDYVWWSNEDGSYNALGLHPIGSWETPLKNSAKGGVCPIIEIPINTGVEIDVSNSEYTYSDGNLVLTKYTGTSQDVTIPNPFYKG